VTNLATSVARHRDTLVSRLRPILAGLACLAAAAARAPAQQLRATTVAGLGTLTFPTSTLVPAAQEAFIRGVLLLHLFHYPQAAEAFRQAEQLDSGFALAYWGEALTHTHPVWNQQDTVQGRLALSKLGPTAVARAAKARTARERAYLGAVEVLYGEGPKARRDTLYSVAMAQLAATDGGGDDEAKLFYALSLLGLNQGVRDVQTFLRAAAIAESVLARNPEHPGAAHYWIHGTDDPDHAAQALAAARALGRIAPEAVHAQHMTSHIFVALGMWDDVVSANERAMHTVDDMRRSLGRGPPFCGHVNTFLHYGYLEQGRIAEARRLLAGCRDQSPMMATMMKPGPRDLDPDSYDFITMWSRYLLDTDEWTGEVARWSVDPGALPAPRLTYWFTRAFGAARQGQLATAREALVAFEQARREIGSEIGKGGVEPTPEEREFLTRAEVLRLELEGLIVAGAGDRRAGLDTLRRAAAVEDGMAYAFGPPYVNEPSRELLGEELLSTGKVEEARHAFEVALTRTPRRASVLLGLARAAAAAGDSAAARRAYGELATIWHEGDPDLAGLAEARRTH
jgi:tetratricopeptide (TPR) repeat protein